MPLYRRTAFRPNPAPAESSYGIWLKHLALSRPYRAHIVPRIVAELGPGLSLGAGLAALICGAERYIALDVVRFAKIAQVLPIFDRLVAMFSRRQQPHNASGFPSYEAALDASGFPSCLLTDDHLDRMLNSARIARLRDDLQMFVRSGGRESVYIDYIAPWKVQEVLHQGRIDFLFSHTVLQHVESLDDIWKQIGLLLRPDGVCSHQISFDSHGTSTAWNGHWAYPQVVWRVALGRKTFLINREPFSRHLNAAAVSGLKVVGAMRLRDSGGIERAAVAREWQCIDDDDLATRGAMLVAQKL
jgi:hypothetical protein